MRLTLSNIMDNWQLVVYFYWIHHLRLRKSFKRYTIFPLVCTPLGTGDHDAPWNVTLRRWHQQGPILLSRICGLPQREHYP